MTLFDLAHLRAGRERADREMGEPDFWDDPEKSQKAMKAKKSREDTIGGFEGLEKSLADSEELIELTEM